MSKPKENETVPTPSQTPHLGPATMRAMGVSAAAVTAGAPAGKSTDDLDDAIADLEKRVKRLRKARDETVAQLKQEFETQLAAQRASWEEERRALQAQIAQGDRRSSSSVAPTPKVVITKPKARLPEKELQSVVQAMADWLAARRTTPGAEESATVFVAGVHERLSKVVSSSKGGRDGEEDTADSSDSMASVTSLRSTKKDATLAPKNADATASRPPLTPAPKKSVRRRKVAQETKDADSVSAKPVVDADGSEVGRRRSSSFDVSKRVPRTQSLLTLVEATQTGPADEGEPEAADEDAEARDARSINEGAPGSVEDKAARAIQRAYRYYRVRGHFRDIVRLARARDAKPNVNRVRASNMSLGPRMSLIEGGTDSPNALVRTSSMAVSASERDYMAGIYEFCYKPEKGIAMLIENGFIENNELAVAEFLAREKRLNKAKVGDYLGTGSPFTDAVVDAFVGRIDFSGLEFDMALRKFLSDSNFRLPGEAQKIARLVEAFGHYYVAANEATSALANEDVAYVLAYSVIMLNTDAHNPNVKRRMTLPEFIKNNRGINNNGDLPEEFLKKLYTSIVTYEIRLSDDDLIASLHDVVDGISHSFEAVKEIKDLFERSPSKTDRIVFVLNDCLLIAATNKKGKHSFRYLYHYIKMKAFEVKDSPTHQNVVELFYPSGRLIFLVFPTNDDKVAFLTLLRQQIAEVAALPEHAQEKLRNFVNETASKALATRTDSDTSLPKRMNTFSRLLSGRTKRTTSKMSDSSESPLPQSVLSMTGQPLIDDTNSDSMPSLDGVHNSAVLSRKGPSADIASKSMMGLAGTPSSGPNLGPSLWRPATAAVTDPEPFPDLQDTRPSFDGASEHERRSSESDRSSIDERRADVRKASDGRFDEGRCRRLGFVPRATIATVSVRTRGRADSNSATSSVVRRPSLPLPSTGDKGDPPSPAGDK